MKPLEASRIAERAHAGHLYGGRDYVRAHVLQVVHRVNTDRRSTPDAIVVAWLHDVVEDTPVTLEELVAGGLTGDQATALEALTRREGEPYGAYLRRVFQNKLATLVKFHDLQANLAAAETLRPELEARYRKVLPFVEEALLGVARCKSCQKPIAYLKTATGAVMPVDRESLPADFDRERLVFSQAAGHVSHFATCPNANKHRRPRR